MVFLELPNCQNSTHVERTFEEFMELQRSQADQVLVHELETDH